MLAAAILCALAAAAPEAAASAGAPEVFFAELEGGRLGLLSEILASGPLRRSQAGLTPAEVKAKVRSRLGSALPAAYVDAAFSHPETRPLEGIADRFNPSTSPPPTWEEYRGRFLTEERIAAGAEFLRVHARLLDDVEARHRVDRGLVAALIGVETFYGRNAGRHGVFNALYTIVMKVPRRSDWAAAELAAWLKICHGQGIGVHSVSGSYAGAFGWYQFMPTSFLAYAVDFDGDGRRRHDDWPDVAGSVARYIAAHGYEWGGSYAPGSRNWKAVYAYNHSEFYVRAVLELREAILARVPSA